MAPVDAHRRLKQFSLATTPPQLPSQAQETEKGDMGRFLRLVVWNCNEADRTHFWPLSFGRRVSGIYTLSKLVCVFMCFT